MPPAEPLAARIGWRTPLVVLLCGCVVAVLSFGPRAVLGFFLTPMSLANGWSREVFGMALAIQNLLWGLGLPFAGAIADRYGTARVLWFGGLLYALGLALMAHAQTPGMLNLSAGVLIGFGMSGCSFNIVLAAFGKLVPDSWRSFAFGLGTAAGSFGQFLFSPLTVALQDAFGWRNTLLLFAAGTLLILPFSLALVTPPATARAEPGKSAQQSLKAALAEALGHRSYNLLVLGFFTCGFQLAFITVHMPAYLTDRGLPAEVGGWTIAAIGFFNMIGSIASGWLGARMPKRYLLSAIYLIRSGAVLALILLPPTPAVAVGFGAVMGLMWLSTVPPTNGLVLVMFGTRWLAMLTGFAFFSHQVGGFLGVWLGGVAFDHTGSYDIVWQLSILLGVLSALINLPIVEKPASAAEAAAAVRA
jgi:MFS family permease